MLTIRNSDLLAETLFEFTERRMVRSRETVPMQVLDVRLRPARRL
jgi:hypothetical protein